MSATLTRVRIGATEYAIEVSDELTLPDRLGTTNNIKQVILLRDDQSGGSARDSLLHEVLHAILWSASAEQMLGFTEDQEEKAVRLLAPWLLMTLRENPDLVAVLLGDEKEWLVDEA